VREYWVVYNQPICIESLLAFYFYNDFDLDYHGTLLFHFILSHHDLRIDGI